MADHGKEPCDHLPPDAWRKHALSGMCASCAALLARMEAA